LQDGDPARSTLSACRFGPTCISASASSAMFWKRSFASFLRQREMTSTSPDGSRWDDSIGVGCASRIAAQISVIDWPTNAVCAVRIS